ncbi:MAG: DUF445 family protein [Proteobacteria bacterium]|nr:DUF445 family protein [Pseudomonadota bacterium]
MDSTTTFTAYTLLIPPVAGAAIGWLTNYVAIKLLFRPHTPVSIFGIKFQGIIPKRRREIARSIAKSIEREVLSSEDIAELLNTIEWKKEVEHIMEDLVEHRLTSNRLSKLPLVGLVTENLSYHLKYLLTKEVLKQIDRKKGDIATKFKENLDLKNLMVSKIDKLDLMSFEGLLTDFISKELKHLEYLGGLMGLLIGIVQSILFYFVL